MTDGGSPFAQLPQVGDRLDRYALVQKLGAGGMGAVFLGLDREASLRRAIKIIPTRTDPETVLRFEREGRAMARVPRHPHVIQVMHAGQTPACHYLVMEFAEGGDLASRLEDGPLDPREAVELVRDLAGGLAHVHGHGVLHRDLKPANVVFQADGRGLLTDFGLAAIPGGKSLTETGTLMGTPAYMAPEQALCEELDARTDVYGLGAVLYHALTGRPPYSGSSALALLSKVVDGNPTGVRALAPGVPIAVEAVCQTAMAKAPGDRYPDAGALQAALDACLVAWTEPAPGAAQLGWVVGAGLVLAAVAGAVTVAVGRAGQSEAAGTPTASATPLPRPTSSPVLPAHPFQGAQSALAAGDVVGARQRLKELVIREPNSGEAWIQLAQVHMCLIELDEAARAASQAQRLLPQDPRPLLLLARSFKMVHGSRSRYAHTQIARARRLNARSREVRMAASMSDYVSRRIEFGRVMVPQPGDAVWIHVAYGSLLEQQGRGREAVRFYDRALDRQPYNVTARVRRGKLHLQHGALEKAVPDVQKALELRPDLARVRTLEIAVLVETGDLSRARTVLDELTRLPGVPAGLATFLDARIMNQEGRPAEALATLQALGPPPHGADDWRLEVARALLWSRRAKEALATISKVQREDVAVVSVRGLARARAGDLEGALADQQLYQRRQGPDTRESLELQFELALAQRDLQVAKAVVSRLGVTKNVPRATIAWFVLRTQVIFGIREKLEEQIERCRKLFGTDRAALGDLERLIERCQAQGLLPR